jgi:hypothetical protein
MKARICFAVAVVALAVLAPVLGEAGPANGFTGAAASFHEMAVEIDAAGLTGPYLLTFGEPYCSVRRYPIPDGGFTVGPNLDWAELSIVLPCRPFLHVLWVAVPHGDGPLAPVKIAANGFSRAANVYSEQNPYSCLNPPCGSIARQLPTFDLPSPL